MDLKKHDKRKETVKGIINRWWPFLMHIQHNKHKMSNDICLSINSCFPTSFSSVTQNNDYTKSKYHSKHLITPHEKQPHNSLFCYLFGPPVCSIKCLLVFLGAID